MSRHFASKRHAQFTLIALAALIFFAGVASGAGPEASFTSTEIEKICESRNLTPAQCKEVKKEVEKRGGTLTEEDVEEICRSKNLSREKCEALKTEYRRYVRSFTEEDAEKICEEKGLSRRECEELKAKIAEESGGVRPPEPDELEKVCQENDLSKTECRDLKREVSKKEILTEEDVERIEDRYRIGGLVREGHGAGFYPEEEGEVESLFTRYLRDEDSVEVSGELKPFGYEFFEEKDKTAGSALPVPSDYVVGPGDKVEVFLWGRMNERHTLEVARDGTVHFPNIGTLEVAGMSFSEMKGFLKTRADKIIGTQISVTMGELRSVQVFVLGELKNPGAYTLKAMTTITGALTAAGGPTGIGSMRDIKLKRADRVVSVLDLYELFLEGDNSADLRLKSGDVVFVPTTGPLVGITGGVKRPGVYELKDESTLSEAVKLAGGLLPSAYAGRVQVKRIEENSARVVVDLDAEEALERKNPSGFILRDADLVRVFSVQDDQANTVTLKGNVKRPGVYELKPGMKLSDLISSAEDLKNETYLDYGVVKRTTRPEGEVSLISFNPGKVLNGSSAEDIELADGDEVFVFSRWLFEDRKTVTIEGEVRKPGEYDLEEDMTVRDLVLKAGKLTNEAYLGRADLYRTDPVTNRVSLMSLNLASALRGEQGEDLPLTVFDRVVVHSVEDINPRRFVTVKGEVTRPGEYPWAENMTVSDLVFAAGSLLDSAYLPEAEVTRRATTDGEDSELVFRTVDLEKALAGHQGHDINLKPDDRLFVKRVPNWGAERVITLEGEVRFPGDYTLKKGERMSSVLRRAGGYTDKAYLKGAVFTRESVRKIQQEKLDQAVERLERQVLFRSTMDIEEAVSSETARQHESALEQKKILIDKMKEAEARGRMVVRLAPIEKLEGGPFDILLKDGDTLHIPERPSTVNVSGAVVNPTSFVYDPGVSIAEYVELAGGVSESANRKGIYVIKVDGSTLSPDMLRGGFKRIAWNGDANRWELGTGLYSGLEPGDTVVVPEKVDKIAWMREIKDITQILYQIAVTAGVIIVAF